MKPEAKPIYVLGLDTSGRWHLSMVETEKHLAAIRYADLRTVMVGVAATMSETLANQIKGNQHSSVKQWVSKCAKKDKGVPLADVRATVATIQELGPGDTLQALRFVESRGGSLQPGGGYRPGFAFNYFRGKSGILYHTGLTSEQHKHMRVQRSLRTQARLKENALV